MKKWLIGMACVGMLATAAMEAMGGLIISQYYEGTGTDKWIEIYNPGPGSVDMAAGGYRLGLWSTAGRETWKTGRTNNYSAVLTNTLAAGETFLYGDSNAVSPSYAVADMVGNVVYFNGDDSIVLYTGEPYAFANVVDAIGFTNTTVAFGSDKSFVRTNTLTTGVNTDFNEAEWLTYTLTNVENAGPGTNERLGYHSTGAATFGVFFDKTTGFEVVAGSSDAITATAANGTAPYGYVWSSTLGASYYTTNAGVFSILATAPIGGYTSTVVATDSAAQSVTNSIGFSVVVPATKYAITITPPVNGTVLTTPATEAEEGQTVAITATGATGYIVDTISVVGADSTPIGTSATFVMPAQAVTITVTFKEAPAGRLVISQYTETDSGSIPKGIEIWNISGADITFDATANLLDVKVGSGGGAPESVVTANSGTLAAGAVWVIGTSNMSPDLAETFLFNGDDAVVLELGGVIQDVIGTVGVDPGTQWSGNGVSTMNQNIQLKDGITTGDLDGWTDPSERFETVGVGSDLTGFGVPPGGATFGVTFDQTSGFTIDQDTTDVITATAANGTAPYSYVWSSTLGASYYTTNAGEFTILATAPIGGYTSTVVATDSAAQSVTNSIGFSVVVPAVPYAITITPATNGTVTTTPATEAEAGQTVTINATPAGGYAVDTYSVVGADSTPIGSSSSFTMPAQDVTVTVTFKVHAGSSLIISEVTDPNDNASAKFVELYNSGASSIDLAAGQWYLARQANGSVSNWANVALTGTVNAAQTYVVIYSASNFALAYPAAAYQQIAGSVVTGNGDDGYFLYSGGSNTVGTLEDAYGVINEDGTGKPWQYENARAARNSGVTDGNPTWTASEWTITASANVADATPGVHPDGPVSFGVTFNKSSGFTVEQGSSDAVTATAANGTAPYGYVWSSTLGSSYYTTNAGVFTILATAPIGGYTSTVVATDSAAQSVTNSIGFSVTAPAPKYAITIVTNAPANGTVTTTPATEAAAGATVTVNATPAGGYAVESIVVNGGAVSVVGNTFTMPAASAAVTVTFMEYTAPDALITFETATLPGAYSNNTATLEDGKIWSTLRVVRGNTAGSDRMIGTNSARIYPVTGTNAVLQQTQAYAEPITQMSFWVGSYGSDNMANVTLTAEVSADGTNWEAVKTLTGAAEITSNLTEHVIATIPANAVYARFVATAAAASGKRVNVDNVAFDFGAAVPSLSYSGATTITMGQSFALTFTLNNGTASGWQYTLESAGREPLDSGSVNTFNWTPSSEGTYYLEMTALDEAVEPIATRELTLTVNPLNPIDPAVIVAGSRSGTVGVEMALTITITNETTIGDEWYIDLKDPDGLDDTSYDFAPPSFTLTPTKTGTYVLTATAVTGSGNYSNVVNLTVGGGGSNQWAIGQTGDGGTMTTTRSNLMIVLPTNYTLNAVYGSDASGAGLNNLGQGLGTLNSGTDYTWTPATRTVTIINTVTNRRFIRIGATP